MVSGTQVRKRSWGNEEVGERSEGSRGIKRRYSIEADFFAYKVKWN